MKDASVAKLASQCEELYTECNKICNRESLKNLWEREWLSMVNNKFNIRKIYLYQFNCR